MRGRGRWAAVLLAATSGLAGLAPVLLATAEPAWAFVAPVKIMDRADGPAEDFDFNPRVTRIFVGDGVTWANETNKKHTVTSDRGNDRFDSDEIAPDGNFDRRFREAGTYNYRCKIHPKMTGVIEVQDPAATTTTATVPPTTATTAPPATTTTAPTTTTATEPTTTTTAARPPAGVVTPPVPATAATPPPTLASSSTTTLTAPTTTTVPPPPASTGPPPPAGDEAAPPSTALVVPPSTAAPTTTGTDDKDSTAAGPISDRDGGSDPATVAMVSALVAVGLFAAWTLIRVRPGRI